MRFNINSHVKVRLTDRGRKLHREWHERILGPLAVNYPYEAPAEDDDGWTTWQLWELAAIFGPFMWNGCDVPFGTEIEIPDQT